MWLCQLFLSVSKYIYKHQYAIYNCIKIVFVKVGMNTILFFSLSILFVNANSNPNGISSQVCLSIYYRPLLSWRKFCKTCCFLHELVILLKFLLYSPVVSNFQEYVQNKFLVYCYLFPFTFYFRLMYMIARFMRDMTWKTVGNLWVITIQRNP